MPTNNVADKRARRSWQRSVRLEALGFDTYSAYLSSTEWRAIKARYRASDLPQDCMCGETENLALHHLTYERVGEERLTDLTPLCKRCHTMLHVLERRGEVGLDFTGFVNERRAQRNQAQERQRIERQRDEFMTPERRAALKAQDGRRLANKILKAQVRAAKHGVDLSPVWSEALEEAHRVLGDHFAAKREAA